MSTLILHIGTMKTGSSALQSFFLRNREALARQGVSFPLFGTQRNASAERNGAFLHRLAFNMTRGDSSATKIDRYDQCRAIWESLSSDRGDVLLSEELFFSNEYFLVDGETKTFASKYWAALRSIVLEAGLSPIHVVVYLRRQDALAASHWKQFVRSGGTSLSLREHILRPSNLFYLDYAATLKTIERELGDICSIAVRRYDRASFEGGDIYHDFCHASGITWDDSFDVPRQDTNTSLSFDVAEALRPLCPDLQDCVMRYNAVIAKAEELTRAHPDLPGTTPFTEDEARAFLVPFQEGNRWVARQCLGDNSLFSDDYTPRVLWVPNEERIAEYRRQLLDVLQEK